MSEQTTQTLAGTVFEPAPMPDPVITANGNDYMMDARGDLKPVETIKAQYKLEDELVRGEFGFALALSQQVARFKGHGYENLGNFDALLDQKYGVTKGGTKGNKTYATYDGLFQIKVRVQDRLDFGPEMASAKALFDECLNEWSEATRPEMRAIVTNAFDTDREGQINRANVFILLNTESEDPRWLRGQEAIRDAIRVIGSASYLQYRFRKSHSAGWQTVTIDLAKAEAPV
ncbi:DUF3164 family protein [Leisingera sp. M658]|uniref:DUF3164 family protein n=1 Tax=Leisingera sp. M658 TaxID=2867015 RepID=UPI0021A611DE|nr:DUF3164 family protein [Leisingera sp. M658]UWQ76805.1 DUF3164 family protein [Leisingera sp. M658]